jgi:hypothetical protein
MDDYGCMPTRGQEFLAQDSDFAATVSSRQDTTIKSGLVSVGTSAIICLEKQRLRRHWRSGDGALSS